MVIIRYCPSTVFAHCEDINYYRSMVDLREKGGVRLVDSWPSSSAEKVVCDDTTSEFAWVVENSQTHWISFVRDKGRPIITIILDMTELIHNIIALRYYKRSTVQLMWIAGHFVKDGKEKTDSHAETAVASNTWEFTPYIPFQDENKSIKLNYLHCMTNSLK